MKTSNELSQVELVADFYSSIINEVKSPNYSSADVSLLNNSHLYYGRYLNPRLRNYFIHTVFPNIANAISFFNIKKANGLRIIDLGCGLGMQSIIFAALGAKVLAIDIRHDSIILCNKRKLFYEKKYNKQLDIDFVCGDFKQLSFENINSKYDAVFSMSAFSYIAPLHTTVAKLSSILANNSKIFLYEENSNYLFSMLRQRSNIPHPQATINAFKKEGFNSSFFYGGCSLPAPFWQRSISNPMIDRVNDLLRRSTYLSFNYILGMHREPHD